MKAAFDRPATIPLQDLRLATTPCFAGRSRLVAIVVFGIAVATPTPRPSPTSAYNVAVASDYVFRGVSQTEEDPAISGGVDADRRHRFYAGDLGLERRPSPATTTPTPRSTSTAAIRPEVAGLNLGPRRGRLFLHQPARRRGLRAMSRSRPAASRAVGPATIGAAVYYSPDFFGASEDEATYVEANAAFTPADSWTVSGAVGRQFVSSDFDYTTWNVGRGLCPDRPIWRSTSATHDTDEHDFGDIYGARAVASLKAVF